LTVSAANGFQFVTSLAVDGSASAPELLTLTVTPP
jgi:hypothetical protein